VLLVMALNLSAIVVRGDSGATGSVTSDRWLSVTSLSEKKSDLMNPICVALFAYAFLLSSRTRIGCQRCSPLRVTKASDKTSKWHTDGLNMLPYFTGETKESHLYQWRAGPSLLCHCGNRRCLTCAASRLSERTKTPTPAGI
jgi:hypothetical protein